MRVSLEKVDDVGRATKEHIFEITTKNEDEILSSSISRSFFESD